MKFQRQNRLLGLLAAISFTHILDFVIMMPLGPKLIRAFGISPSFYGMIVSSYTFSAGIFGFLGAYLLDRFDRRHALLVLYTGFIAGTLACGFSPSAGALIIARIVAGGFGGMLSALIFSIIGDVFAESQRGRATGIVMSAFSVASVIGVPIGLKLADRWGWHVPFIVIAVVATGLALSIRWILPPMTGHIHSDGRGALSPVSLAIRTLKSPNELWAIGLNFLLVVSSFSLIPYISTYLVCNVGMPETRLFLVYLMGGGATFFTAPLIGKLSDRFGKRRVFMVVAVAAIIPILLLPLMPRWPMPLMLIVTTLFFIFVSGRIIPAMAMITSSTTSDRRGSFLSIATAAQQLGSGIGASVAGAVIVQDTTGALRHYGLVGFVSALVTLLSVLVAGRIRIVNEGHRAGGR